MAKLVYGDRIGRKARLIVGAAAVLFDESRQKVLLTQRTDNGRWCLPGGAMDAGESASECCEREVWEETGLRVRVRRLIGIYTTPHRIVEYADGNRYQFVSFCFEVTLVGGELALSNETTAYGYFSQAEMAELDLMENHAERINDAFAGQVAAFVR
jgi:8-oxo-dGTP pyrophosphatase MutT (NUDIX family)